MDKANDDENGSQFFITLVPSSQLYEEFTIFGQVPEDTSGALVSLLATKGEEQWRRISLRILNLLKTR